MEKTKKSIIFVSMKNWIYILIIVTIFLYSCSNTPKTGTGKYSFNNPISAENTNSTTDFEDVPTIQLKEKEYNFGVVINGEKVAHIYTFKNVGKTNLLIANVKTSCGCTSPKWTKEPIAPGAEGYIELSFDSTGRLGQQRKTAIIYANTIPNETEISFQCEVINQ